MMYHSVWEQLAGTKSNHHKGISRAQMLLSSLSWKGAGRFLFQVCCAWFSTAGVCPEGLGTCARPTEHLWLRKENCSCGSLGTVRKSVPSYSWVRKYWAWLCCTVGPAKPLLLWELQHLWDSAKPSFSLSTVLRWLRDSFRQQLKYKRAELFRILDLLKDLTHIWQFMSVFLLCWMRVESDQERPQSVYLTPRDTVRWFVW